MRVGYIRVSTTEQNLAAQQDAMKRAGITKVFEEKRSGLDDARPVLRECTQFLREGDELVVTRADRLARSARHLHNVMHDMGAKGVTVTFLEQPELNSNTPQAKLLLGILSSVAQFETDLRAARQAEGISAAKARGVRFGRPKSVDQEQVNQIRTLREQGVAVRDVMQQLGISKSTVMRAQRIAV